MRLALADALHLQGVQRVDSAGHAFWQNRRMQTTGNGGMYVGVRSIDDAQAIRL